MADKHNGAEKHNQKHHPNYFLIALWLFIVTVLEVWVAQYARTPAGEWIPLVPVLLLMAVVKASMVTLYFMHLRFDSRVFTFFFMVPVLFGVLFILAVIYTPGA